MRKVLILIVAARADVLPALTCPAGSTAVECSNYCVASSSCSECGPNYVRISNPYIGNFEDAKGAGANVCRVP